jgi:hypothetical protein
VWEGLGGALDATTTLPPDGMLGPGVHRIVVTSRYTGSGAASCTAVGKVQPCKPIVIGSTVRVNFAPGLCTAYPKPSDVVSADTLGRGALGINARTRATGSVVPAPLKGGTKYFVQVVYPGDLLSAVSASSTDITVVDVEPPVAAIKSSVMRDNTGGFICARGTSVRSTNACLSVSATAAASVVSLSDNCGAA